MEIQFSEIKERKEVILNEDDLDFGKVFADYMLEMDYDMVKGWHDARIVEHHPLSLDPQCMVLHYAQEIFEGLKAYRCDDQSINLFRVDLNAKRFYNSAIRMAIPPLEEETFVECVKAYVDKVRDWVPQRFGNTLYLRPFIIATDNGLGVRASRTFKFMIIASPSAAYFKTGLDPVDIFVEEKDIRSAPGLTGFAKCGGNYAASLRAGEKAEEKGYAQVLWLDGVERKYIEEVGSMNVMFKIGDEIVTPKLTGSVLPGITRKSCVELLRAQGYTVNERLLSVDELTEALESGKLAYAGIDVLEIEPMDKDCPICGVKNCFITPHIAWAPMETRERLMGIVCDNLRYFLSGSPKNVVNHPNLC